MRSVPSIASRDRSRGATLVEVLVTVVVISVGLLGIAALQTISMRDTHAAVVRSQATALADYIIDRMRANRRLVAGVVDMTAYEVAFEDTVTGTDRATNDLADWKTLLAANGADGDIEVVGRVVTVTVRMREREMVRGGDEPAAAFAELDFVTRTEI